MPYHEERSFDTLKGKTLTNIENVDGDELIFTCSDGDKYKLCHFQDCCESVTIEDICGDLSDLIGSPILVAEEVSSEEGVNPDGVKLPEYQDDCFLWTFYKLDTANGGVTIRWYGESNGYYSVSVDFKQVD